MKQIQDLKFTFHYAGCLIVILVMDYDPHRTGQYIPLYIACIPLKKHVLLIAQVKWWLSSCPGLRQTRGDRTEETWLGQAELCEMTGPQWPGFRKCTDAASIQVWQQRPRRIG